MRKIDYSFLKGLIPSSLLIKTNNIYDLRRKELYRLLDTDKLFEKLDEVAIVDSTINSFNLEGIVSTKKRIYEIQNGGVIENDIEKEILGYSKVLKDIIKNYNKISFSIDTIKSFYKKVSSSDFKEYKREDNVVMELLDDGTTKVAFYPTKAKDTNDQMNEWIDAFTNAYNDKEISNLLLIPCAILDFLCIQPFESNNGTLSRLLINLMLLKSDFDIERYMPIENMMVKDIDEYYNVLESSYKGWSENKNNYIPFIEYFLDKLYLSYKELDDRFIIPEDNKLMKKNRIEEIILSSRKALSKMQISELAPDISIKMIEFTLANLLKSGVIVKTGSFKDAKYKKKR